MASKSLFTDGPRPRHAAPLWQILLAVFALGATVALVTAIRGERSYIFEPGNANPIVLELPRHLTFLRTLLPFLWWLALAPAAVAVARALGVPSSKRMAALPLHLGLAAAFSFLHAQACFLLSLQHGSWQVLDHPGLTSDPVLEQGAASLFVYWVIVSFAYAFDYSLSYRERAAEAARLQLRASRLEWELAQSRLSALRGQLNPHFLFNTLNSVSALVEWRPKDARRVIAMLSDLLRLTLNESESQLVPLHREIDWLQKYHQIQQIRFGDRLVVEVAIPPEFMRALVPPLVLQPLVENAIKHGLESSSDRVSVRADAELDGAILRLTVSDDGPGLSGTAEGGVGLSNTRRRLEVLYGERQRVVLRNRSGRGAEAIVELPFQEAVEERGGDLVVEEVIESRNA